MIEELEIARIVARIAMADESFLGVMIQAAKDADQQMLPEDVAKLEEWSVFVRLLRKSVERKIDGLLENRLEGK